MVQQTGQPPTNWELLTQSLLFPRDFIVGPDKQVWFIDQTYIGQANVATGSVRETNTDGQVNAISNGPDGKVWYCTSGETYGYVTPGGVIKAFPLSALCGGITPGPDGSVWLLPDNPCQLVQAFTDGFIVTYNAPSCPSFNSHGIAVDATGKVWFGLRSKHYSGYESFDPATQTWNSYQFPSLAYFNDTLVRASDGLVYGGLQNGDLVQINPDGTNVEYTLGHNHVYSVSPAGKVLYILDRFTKVITWDLKTHVVKDVPTFPLQALEYPTGAVLGPDGNIWVGLGRPGGLGVFIYRILTVAPTSATLSVGQQQTFSVSETHCSGCSITASTSDPSIATVSPVSGGSFVVTAVAAGTATVTVADRFRNSFSVTITVM